jgi:hypothetical protein
MSAALSPLIFATVLPTSAKLVALRLADATDPGAPLIASITVKQLAADCGITSRRAQGLLRELEAASVIALQLEGDPGRKSPRQYRLDVDRLRVLSRHRAGEQHQQGEAPARREDGPTTEAETPTSIAECAAAGPLKKQTGEIGDTDFADALAMLRGVPAYRDDAGASAALDQLRDLAGDDGWLAAQFASASSRPRPLTIVAAAIRKRRTSAMAPDHG